MTLSDLLGPELAAKQPHLVPLFSLFDWASGNDPEGDPRDFFALQPGGKVPGTNLLDDPVLMALFCTVGAAADNPLRDLVPDIGQAPSEYRFGGPAVGLPPRTLQVDLLPHGGRISKRCAILDSAVGYLPERRLERPGHYSHRLTHRDSGRRTDHSRIHVARTVGPSVRADAGTHQRTRYRRLDDSGGFHRYRDAYRSAVRPSYLAELS